MGRDFSSRRRSRPGRFVFLGLLVAVLLGAACLGVRAKRVREARGAEANRGSPAAGARIRAERARRGPLPRPLRHPRIAIMKGQRELRLYSGDEVVRTYPIGLGVAPEGDKEREGDGRTPEGDFYVCNRNPQSSFCLALGLSYPSEEDARRGLRAGLITQEQHDRIVEAIRRNRQPPWDTALGGEIFIHGSGSDRDWTLGCIALDDEDIRELYDAVPLRTPVTIRP